MSRDSIKDILVNVPTTASAGRVIDYAISVAAAFEAHLTGVVFAYEPAVPGVVFDSATAGIIATYRAQIAKASQTAVAQFNDAVRRAGLSVEAHVIECRLAEAGARFARLARHYDLAVVAQAEDGGSVLDASIAETALFGAGRPILAVPYIQSAGIKLDRVMVCWDESRAAARAVGDAMPLLEQAKAIDVVSVSDANKPVDELPGVQLAGHLARHKLKVDFKRLVADKSDAASMLLSYAADTDADLMVMGGYGHSRLREFVVGGVTREMLRSMTVPVLMSH
jgi:nucleotide-binding universal stress UspA family protein